MSASGQSDDHLDDWVFDDDDGLDEDGNFPFECPAYWIGGQWVCPLAGTEECDWDCKE